MKTAFTLLVAWWSIISRSVGVHAQFNSYVFVDNNSGDFTNRFCAGVLVHSDLVLTDVSCERRFNNQLVQIGLTDRTAAEGSSDYVNVDQESTLLEEWIRIHSSSIALITGSHNTNSHTYISFFFYLHTVKVDYIPGLLLVRLARQAVATVAPLSTSKPSDGQIVVKIGFRTLCIAGGTLQLQTQSNLFVPNEQTD